ncbi:MAG: Peroxyureidoacrylate/ureidoacrylate amidohydrolase RutB [Syntrophus sp. SKADARSKE-3]|nr:Peroxyureidoacrylate/ureidoacrylate amidohydrolase RutB [Syntrophus sp. SKADARSKE-3]
MVELTQGKPLIKSKTETALLVIDMQIYQAGEGGNLPHYFGFINGPDAEESAVRRGREVVPVIRRLLSAFRDTSACVVFTAFGSLTEDGSDLVPYVRLWNRKCRERFGFPAIVSVSDPGYVIIPDISPLPNEPVINKTAQGAFNSSIIDHVLRQRGINTIVATGMYTNHCVMSTCIGAADAGYRVIVPEDAVGSWNQDQHEQALDMMRTWVIRTSSDRIIRELALP